MIYVYRRTRSSGARELSDALGGRRFLGRVRPIDQQVKAGDVVISWGEVLPQLPLGVKRLNGAKIQNKYADAKMLIDAQVPTITVSAGPPVPQADMDDQVVKACWEDVVEAAEDFIEIPLSRSPVYIQGIQDFLGQLKKLSHDLAAPPAPVVEWLPRMFSHVGGNDLLNPPAVPDFWVKKVSIVKEVRIHSFLAKSIRAGQKVVRDNAANPHPWVRSYDGGWSINYDGFRSTKAQRTLAHAAVAALGLDFGAVDLAQLATGQWIVLEVNRAPGLEGGSVTAYVTAIQNWIAAPVI